ncbi:MAG TPA: metallophosphoesterase family protein [Acidisarcina sp.]
MRIGVISDTHGLLRPEALAALAGVDHVLHAGDVGDPTILDILLGIAPVIAVRGNIDTGGPCSTLPATEVLELGGLTLYMLHSAADLDLDPSAAGFAAVISGHSHKPQIKYRNSVLYFNPGSAGPRRFTLPVSVGCLTIRDAVLHPELITLL